MPDGELTLVCREEYGRLFQDAGFVDRLVAAGGRRAAILFGGPSGADPEDPALGRGLFPRRRLDAEAARSLVGRSLKVHGHSGGPGHRSARASFRPGQPLFLRRDRLHYSACGSERAGLRRMRPAACEREGRRVRARAPIGHWTAARPYAVVHPGSGGESKRWPLANFLEIVRRLADSGMPGVLVTGDAEERPSFSGPLEEGGLPPGWTWLRRPSLSGLAALLAECLVLRGERFRRHPPGGGLRHKGSGPFPGGLGTGLAAVRPDPCPRGRNASGDRRRPRLAGAHEEKYF